MSEKKISGAELLSGVEKFVSRFVAYPSPEACTAHVLWIAHTHFMDRWESTPRLLAVSQEPSSGKTRLLEVTEHLVPNGVIIVGPSESYLFRKIAEDVAPTLLFDEIDTVFGPKAPTGAAEGIRRVLNAGHRKGVKVGRTVVGDGKFHTESLSAYCAVAIAGLHLDDLPDTLRKRSVILKMRARLKNEKVEPWRVRIHEPEAKKLGGKIAKWSRSSSREIRWPKLPPGIEDRNADVWEPLIAVADAAGGEWPGKARAAALTLVSLTRDKAVSIGVRLLRDLRTIWGDARARHTADILTKLREMPESEWKGAEGRRSALSDRELAKLLGAYDIVSDDINLDGRTLKGYWRTDRREGKGGLTDAWERYLGINQEQSAQSAQPASEVADVAEVAVRGG